MKPPALSVRNLSISYPGLLKGEQAINVVTSLSFKAHAGEFYCLSGRSGSGKTSILRYLAGMSQPPPGSVFWGEQDLGNMSEDERAQLRNQTVGYADQQSALIEELTCMENVLLPALPHGRSQVRRSRHHGQEVLERLGLGKWLHALPSQMSGGMRQRLALAQVLTARTPVILADEPTASLDRSWADEVIEVLLEHQQNGGIVVVASHDSHMAQAAGTVIDVEAHG